MEFKLHNGSGSLCCKSCGRQDKQLNTYDWLADIPGNTEEQEMVEVQFKNTRKGYYKNSNKLKLEKGDIVAVEASPGHDIGTVTLTGRLVPLQMRKANIKPDAEIKRIYRKAKPVDMEKYEEAKAKEHDTMIRSRQIAKNLNLQCKSLLLQYLEALQPDYAMQRPHTTVDYNMPILKYLLWDYDKYPQYPNDCHRASLPNHSPYRHHPSSASSFLQFSFPDVHMKH